LPFIICSVDLEFLYMYYRKYETIKNITHDINKG